MAPLGLDGHFWKFVLPVVACESVLWKYAFGADPRTCQVVLSLLGLWWCFAALWVEVKIEMAYHKFDYKNPEDPLMRKYRPFCDFAPWATCSVVLMSPPGRFLRYFGIAKEGGGQKGLIDTVRGLIDVPNPTLGVLYFMAHLFWPVILILPIPFLPQLFLLACTFVGGMTIWLAYNLFFVLKDFCVVCVSQYVVNFALIPTVYHMLHASYDSILDFGAVPKKLLYPFLAMDAVMGVAVLLLWLWSLRNPRADQDKRTRLLQAGA